MLRQKYAVFTMDVEAFTDTECVSASSHKVSLDVLDGFDEYLKILDKYNIKSTLFTVGNFAPQMAKRLENAIAKGHRLALHGQHHTPPLNIPPDTFRAEIAEAKERLTKLFRTEVSGFRAPCFSMDNARLNILKELGFKYDSSNIGFEKARHTTALDLTAYEDHGNGIFSDKGFFEFSIAKQKIFGIPFPISGGGYMRLADWNFMKFHIKQYLQRNNYYVFYLHPFELTSQKIPILKDLKAYDKYYLTAGIRSFGKHIEQLICMLQKFGFQFITFEELHEKLSANP